MEEREVDDTPLDTVGVYGVRHEAEVAKAALVSAGIEAMVIADDEGGLNPGFFADYGVRVVVHPRDGDAARAVLDPAEA